jgi:hypothetical protein
MECVCVSRHSDEEKISALPGIEPSPFIKWNNTDYCCLECDTVQSGSKLLVGYQTGRCHITEDEYYLTCVTPLR